MKRSFVVILALLIGTSCGKAAKRNRESRDQATIDSLVALQLDEVNRKAMEDLDYRMTITVQQKADSIVQARMTAQQ